MDKTKVTAGVCIENEGEKAFYECDLETLEKTEDGTWVCSTCQPEKAGE